MRRSPARGGRHQRDHDRHHRRRLRASYYSHGDIVAPLAAAAVLGTFFGSRAGLWFGGRARAKWLKLMMAAVLLSVSAIYLAKAL